MLTMRQAVNALDGTLLDDYTLTKPSGWAANATRQTATMTNFVGNFTSTWYESYGEWRQHWSVCSITGL